MPYTYILLCGDGTYYTGCAKDLETRLQQHESGKGARYTRGRLPVKLVYCEHYKTLGEAMRRENKVKRWPRSKKQSLIESGRRR